MATKKGSKNNKSNGLGIGLTVASIASAAGAVFLFGTEAGKKKRKQIKSWSLKAKAEVLEKIENMKDVNEEAYQKVVDTVSQKYSNLKNAEKEEVEILVKDLKKAWKDIKKIASPANVKKVKKVISKPVDTKK